MRAGYAYTRSERIADLVIHVLGLAFAAAAVPLLYAFSLPAIRAQHALPLVLYALGLVAMLTCSALYNLTSHPARKALFRRLDHTAIFLMIAGTYSPYALIGIGGAVGDHLFAFVWLVALCGVALKLSKPGRFERVSIVLYLLLGWCGIAVFHRGVATLPRPSLTLLLVGAALYTSGVVFHLRTRLPHHNAIWHAFVLAAAVAQYLSILIIVGRPR